MAWTTPTTRTTGELITASIWNTDLVDDLIALRAGGIAIASQAALDFLYASSATQLARLAAGAALSSPRINAAGNAWEFAAPLVTLIGQAEGTDTTAAATNVATFAISGLTVKDTIRIYLRHASSTQVTAQPSIYNVTDSKVLFLATNGGAAVAASAGGGAVIDIGNSPNVNNVGLRTTALGLVGAVGADGELTATVHGTQSSQTTLWTDPFTIALRTGTGGVTAGGTYYYRISVYKIAGQQ